MRFFPLTMLTIGAFLTTPSLAIADEIDATLTTDYVSEYVFRGATFAGNAVQPGVEVSFENITVGAWGSLPIGEEGDSFADEVRLYASYMWNFSDKVDITAGVTMYHFPQSGDLFDFGISAGDASTLEFYSAVDYDVAFSPSLTAYYDIDLKAFTGMARLGHAYPLTKSASFDVSAEIGFVTSDTGTDYEWAVLSGSLNWFFSDTISAYAQANYGSNKEKLFIDTNFDPEDPTTVGAARANNVWFGFGLRGDF